MTYDKRLPVLIGTVFLREYGTNGAYTKIDCARGVQTTLDTTDKTVNIECDSQTLATLEQPSVQMAFTIIRTKSVAMLANLFDLTANAITAGAIAITAESNIFDANGVIELKHRSNDNLGLTTPVVTSADAITTYVLGTDYNVAVTDNITTITLIGGGAITAGATVLVSGSINQNAANETSITASQRVKKTFEVMIEGVYENSSNVNEYTQVTIKPAVLSSTYLLEFINAIKAGDVQGANLVFDLQQGGTFEIRDEVI